MTSPGLTQRITECRQVIITFIIAYACGWLCLLLNMPAPYLLGSLFGVWFSGGLVKPLQPHLGVARWVHIPVVLGLGVLIGVNFTPDVLGQIGQWTVTLTAMIVTTAVVAPIIYAWLRRRPGYDPVLAFLCATPGGQAECIVLAREYVEKDYVVALFHLVRVAAVFVSTPLLLAMIEGQDAVLRSNVVLETMPAMSALPAGELLMFAGVAVIGYGLAVMLRLPMPHLLGPMGLSMAVHMTGMMTLPRISEFVLLAQLTIGGGVGARLARVSITEVIKVLGDAFQVTALIIAAYLGAAFLMAAVSGENFLRLWLAFVPGGLYEVTLLALLFGFDVAFVAFHHTVRVVMIFLALPALTFRLDRKVKAGAVNPEPEG